MKRLKLKKGDKVRTNFNKVETFICYNWHGQVITIESKNSPYHVNNVTKA